LSESLVDSKIMGLFGQVERDPSAQEEVMIAQTDAFVRSEFEEGIPSNYENYLEGSLRTRVPELDARLAI
jgi:hypothetical protein